MRGLLLTVAAGLALAGCGASDDAKTTELREWLRQTYEFDNGYDGLGAVTYENGDVTVDTKAWHDPGYGAYLYCSWVENWVHRAGGGTADSQIIVIMDGREILRSRGASETCVEAEPNG